MFLFKPAIWSNSVWHELPRPVTAVRLHDSWDFAQFKVPLHGGDFVAGRSRNGVDISLEGQVGKQAADVVITEEAMFEALEDLRQALHPSSPAATYELFLYADAATSTYRSLRSCTTVRFEYDLSEPRLFTYSLLVHATDPAIYTTAPA